MRIKALIHQRYHGVVLTVCGTFELVRRGGGGMWLVMGAESNGFIAYMTIAELRYQCVIFSIHLLVLMPDDD